jgi:putative membrane protein
MITYNSKEWLGVFQLHKADTFRKLLPLMLGIGAYTWGLAWIEKEWLHLPESSPVKNVITMHSLVGFALSMLLVFRTNSAYDRWWEGRKLWGSLVNNSRNLALKLCPMLAHSPEQRAFFASAIPTFAVELMQHLRSAGSKFEMDERPHPEIPNFDTAKHVPSQAAGLIISRIYSLQKEGTISAEQMLLINGELTSLMDICGACERIRNTPIPYSYSVFIKKFIFVYVITLPFSLAFTLGYISIPVVAIIFYLLGSLELIAEEIEEPFGADQNDLPMDRLCKTIEKTVREILA